MTRAKQWHIDIYIDEHDGHTRAEVRLRNPDRTGLVGTGTADRHPDDLNVPEIGDELAVARALANLAEQLTNVTRQDIESVTRPSSRPGG
jgi:hypothetical protein